MSSNRIDDILQYIKPNEDERTANWPLMSSFRPVLFMCVSYVVLVTFLGPAFMKSRKAYNIQKVVICYNLFQVLLSLYMFQGFAFGGWLTGYNYICQPQDFTINTRSNLMIHTSYVLFLSKISELLETVFFVLRKKQNQVNFLHVYHHTVTLPTIWLLVKYAPTGHSTFPWLFNCFVHFIMYTYYFLSSLGPSTRRFLWWKNYLTALQIIQFCVVCVHSCIPFIIECDVPKIILFYGLTLSLSFLILFMIFYKRTYKKTEKDCA